MNCADCHQRLDSYLDRELNPTELLQVQLHLDTCPSCAARYEFHSHLQRLVKSCCTQDLPPAPFLSHLRALLA